MDTIGILSILKNKHYRDVKELWKMFETKYNSLGVQTFNHPNITFQSGKTENLKQLKKDFSKIVSKLKPLEINVDGYGHFNKKVIYLKVKKTNDLIKLNKINP